MSLPQLKSIEMSQLPRQVVERTLRTPGTPRTASSIGRVTSMIMRSAGRSPESTETTTRGNGGRREQPDRQRGKRGEPAERQRRRGREQTAPVGLQPVGQAHSDPG